MILEAFGKSEVIATSRRRVMVMMVVDEAGSAELSCRCTIEVLAVHYHLIDSLARRLVNVHMMRGNGGALRVVEMVGVRLMRRDDLEVAALVVMVRMHFPMMMRVHDQHVVIVVVVIVVWWVKVVSHDREARGGLLLLLLVQVVAICRIANILGQVTGLSNSGHTNVRLLT